MLKPKYYLYARKSTEDDDHQIMSIEAQLFELRQFARKEGLEILEEFTEAKSAKKPGREKFNEMIRKIEQSDGVGILAWHPDRLARNSVDGGKIIYLVDTKKIVSLRFPTFWFEPTPQGLFMLQVAFGQSKYYSDNLIENIKRGIRQKLRRGEWLTKAPFGYVNNPKTRKIKPDSVKSKIIARAFEEFSTGKHTFKSLAEFLAELGITTKHGTPLAKASIQRLLTNRAYLGLVKYKGEYFEGSFGPILSPQLFEAVQKVLKQKAKPRKTRTGHNFPFTGLLTCGECGCAITVQWATGKCGGKYRYYRCTKKKGNCGQRYIQEKDLAVQLKQQLQKVAIGDEWVEKFLRKVGEWEKEETRSSQTFIQNLERKIEENQVKLDKLVSLYLDGDIPRESYLKKKEELMKEKLHLNQQKQDFGQKGENWIEPLRSFILDTKKANFLASSDDYHEIKEFVRKVGTNAQLFNKSISFSFCPPFDFVASRLARSPAEPRAERGARQQSPPKNLTSSEMWNILNYARTFYERLSAP
jgi:DNA invertase Pin-like site-specific DNA recombinase/sulfur relay (sulfurtransferase) DsrC/TusE family protein